MHPLTRQENMPRRRRDGASNIAEAEAIIRPNDRLSSFERLEIYNRQYWYRLFSCFEEDFPGLQAILGRAKFDALMRAYLTDCPSESFSLRNLGSRLEIWLAEHPEHLGPHPLLAEALHARLAVRAPWAAAEIDPNDRQRVVRALELLDLGELEPPEGESQLWSEDLRHPTLMVGLTMEREALYAAIDARVEAMLAAGAREEVRRAHAAGASQTARKALGFEELLTGDVEAMKRRTRNYAKRQLTWMRKLAGVRAIDVSGREADASAGEIVELDAAAGPA